MDTATILSIISTIAVTLGGKEAWLYYKNRLELRANIKMLGSVGEAELQGEIKGILEGQIRELKLNLKELTDRIKIMEEERENDKKRIANQEIKIVLLSERLASRFISVSHGLNNLNNDIDLKIEDDV